MIHSLRELLLYRTMLTNLTVKELSAKYRESFLGFLWSLLNPLLTMLVYTLVFTTIMKINLPAFPVFLLSGTLAWNFMQFSVSSCATVITNNSNLIKKVYFPSEVLPLSIIFSNFINLLLNLIIFFIVSFLFHRGLSMYLLELPLLFAAEMLFVIGFSMIMATMTVWFRDIEHFIGVVMFAWFYVTPIVFPITMISAKYHSWFMLNPMTLIIEQYQRVLYWHESINWHDLGIFTLIAAAVCLLGYSVIVMKKHRFAEEI